MLNRLFVYGTLMQQSEVPIALVLKANSQLLAKGSMAGTLYDLGSYPGAVFDADSAYQVKGQVLMLDNPELFFPLLDEYEGIRHCADDEYTRTIVPIIVDGQLLDCWVYLYRLPTEQSQLIPNGDYALYLTNKN